MTKLLLFATVVLMTSTLQAQSRAVSFEDPKGTMPAQPYGYSQVVTVPLNGHMLFISGQTAWDSTGAIIGDGDFKAQLLYCLRAIEKILVAKGARKSDIVKLNYYVKNLDEPKMYAVTEVAHQFFTGKAYPAGCLLGVAGLADARFLVEVEATAIVVQ